METQYCRFAKFCFYIFSKVALCREGFFPFRNPSLKGALAETEEFFKKNSIDEKFKDLIKAFLTEWDNSEDEICYFIESLYKARNFEELEELLLKNPGIRDTLLS